MENDLEETRKAGGWSTGLYVGEPVQLTIQLYDIAEEGLLKLVSAVQGDHSAG